MDCATAVREVCTSEKLAEADCQQLLAQKCGIM
jgi:hypothetical protein